jgi:hypothetical protein
MLITHPTLTASTSITHGAIIGAVLGALVSGGVVLFAQWRQHVRARTAALRALFVEMMGNANAALNTSEFLVLLRETPVGGSRDSQSWQEVGARLALDYSNHVWTEQLPLLADRLEWPKLRTCMDAYSYASLYFHSIRAPDNSAKFLDKAFIASACKFRKAIDEIYESKNFIRCSEKAVFEADLKLLRSKSGECDGEPSQPSNLAH